MQNDEPYFSWLPTQISYSSLNLRASISNNAAGFLRWARDENDTPGVRWICGRTGIGKSQFVSEFRDGHCRYDLGWIRESWADSVTACSHLIAGNSDSVDLGKERLSWPEDSHEGQVSIYHTRSSGLN